MPDLVEDLPLSIDHIIARQHFGETNLSNLALACLHCNQHKGTNLTGIDPLTRRLFHPRKHKWHRHFRWDGPYLVGLTAIGRSTIQVLAMNDGFIVNFRRLLIEEGTFPAE
jgi:hypothetical protein